MAAASLDELRVLMYHPRFSSDGERGRRIASAFLGRDLRHGQLGSLTGAEIAGLISHLKQKLHDNAKAAVAKAATFLSDRR